MTSKSFYSSTADPVHPDTLIIVNPASGGGSALAAEPLVASYLSSQSKSVQFVHSRSSENIREQAANGAAEGYRYVIALGGDGAFHHVVEGIRGTGAIAGFFPAGNGNDIARDLGIPADAVSAAAAFSHSAPRAVDLVRVQFRDGRTAHFIGAGGMGLDADEALSVPPRCVAGRSLRESARRRRISGRIASGVRSFAGRNPGDGSGASGWKIAARCDYFGAMRG